MLGSYRQAEGVAVDPHGNVYVADTHNWRVQKFSPKGKRLGQWTVLTSVGDTSDPVSLAVDAHGAVYWADAAENVFRKLSATGKLLRFGEVQH